MDAMSKARDEIAKSTQDGAGTVAPMIEQGDLDFLAQTKVKLS